MSDTPKLDFEERQKTQQVYEECCENPEDFAYNFVALQSELAAAQEKIAELRQNLQTAEGAIQDRITERDAALKRIAELEHALPPADKLRILADWLDVYDDSRRLAGECEAQSDLRRWADAIDAAREKDKPLWNGYDDGLPHHNR